MREAILSILGLLAVIGGFYTFLVIKGDEREDDQ